MIEYGADTLPFLTAEPTNVFDSHFQVEFMDRYWNVLDKLRKEFVVGEVSEHIHSIPLHFIPFHSISFHSISFHFISLLFIDQNSLYGTLLISKQHNQR